MEGSKDTTEQPTLPRGSLHEGYPTSAGDSACLRSLLETCLENFFFLLF